MSLISEALKEAQRERTERAGPRVASTIVDNIFPYPTRGASGRAPTRNLVVASTAVLVVLAGATLGVRWFLHRTPKTVITAPVSRPIPAPLAPSPRILATTEQPTASRVLSVEQVPPSRKVQAPAPKSGVAEPVETAAPRAAAAAADSSARKPVAAPAPTAPIVQPQGAAASGVRIVLDPSGTRPSDSLFAAAFAEHKRGNLEMARDLYEKALRRPPVAPDLYNNYGALLASLNNHTAAIVMYGLGLKVNENDPRLWTNLAASYNATGRHAEAMSAYAQAAKLDPTNGIVKTRLAAEYVALGDTTSARRMYEDAAHAAPKEPAVHYAYGSWLKSQGDVKGAIREFQLFVDLGAASYDAPTIEKMRKYVAALRQANP